jgi:hypothetical protein
MRISFVFQDKAAPLFPGAGNCHDNRSRVSYQRRPNPNSYILRKFQQVTPFLFAKSVSEKRKCRFLITIITSSLRLTFVLIHTFPGRRSLVYFDNRQAISIILNERFAEFNKCIFRATICPRWFLYLYHDSRCFAKFRSLKFFRARNVCPKRTDVN